MILTIINFYNNCVNTPQTQLGLRETDYFLKKGKKSKLTFKTLIASYLCQFSSSYLFSLSFDLPDLMEAESH